MIGYQQKTLDGTCTIKRGAKEPSCASRRTSPASRPRSSA